MINHRIPSIFLAASYGHLNVVKVLIAAGADISITDKFDTTTILAACCNGHVEVVKVLLAANANILVTNKEC